MKQQVLTYLQTDRSFTNGKALYGSLPGKNLAFNNVLNRMSGTEVDCSKLHYEIAKCVGITERHLGIILRVVVTAPKKQKVLPITPVAVQGPEKPVFEGGLKGFIQIKKFTKTNDISVEGTERPDFDAAVDAWWENQLKSVESELKNSTTTLFIDSDEKEKQSVKLYDQFPFLLTDQCPDVYKILTTDLATTYRKYKEAHPRLFELLTAEERLEAVKNIVDPYQENKVIWEELSHFQTEGKPLGKHLLVREYARSLEIIALKTEDLAKLKVNLIGKINRNKNKLEKLEGKKGKDKVLLITKQEKELHLVETELKTR